MMLHGKLRPGFYIATVFLAAAVALLLWFLPSWLSEDILLDDNTPLPAAQKTVITVIFILVLLSWTVSLIVMIMQIVRGSLFTADASGITHTLQAMVLFALIIVIPIRKIPREAIENLEEKDGHLQARLNKRKVDVCPLWRPFVQKTYHFGYRFAKTDPASLRELYR
ncbi:MAG TPA: hypothetical protein H9691_09050 [Firmicutes bacterium]|nr:hypothetical protein [Bacillota bacterium]